MKIVAYIKRTEDKRGHYKTIDNSLESLQAYVGGYIEAVSIGHGVTVICNEDGRLIGLPYNCTINGVDFFGNVALVGTEGGEFVEFPIEADIVADNFTA